MINIDWQSLAEVKALCRKLGLGSIVTKHTDRDNYNITPKSRTDLYTPKEVVYDPTEDLLRRAQ